MESSAQISVIDPRLNGAPNFATVHQKRGTKSAKPMMISNTGSMINGLRTVCEVTLAAPVSNFAGFSHVIDAPAGPGGTDLP